MKAQVITLFNLAIAIQVGAQFNENIRTGKPGWSIGPFAVGRNVFQTQSGIDIGSFEKSPEKFSGMNIAPNTVIRF